MRTLWSLLLAAGLLSLQGCCTCFIGKICNFTPSNGKAVVDQAQTPKAKLKTEPTPK